MNASYPLHCYKAMKKKAKRLEDPETEILCKVDVIVFDCECFFCLNSAHVIHSMDRRSERSINPFFLLLKLLAF